MLGGFEVRTGVFPQVSFVSVWSCGFCQVFFSFLSYARCVLLLVFLLLTDVLLVTEAVATNRPPRSEEELQTIRSTRLVLQWMPSHCGIEGHEEACLAGCGRRAGRKQGHPHRDENAVSESLYRM